PQANSLGGERGDEERRAHCRELLAQHRLSESVEYREEETDQYPSIHLLSTDHIFSPDGKYALAVSPDQNHAKLQSLSSGKYIALSHEAKVTAGAISADSRTAVTVAADGTVRLWRVRSGRRIHEWKDERSRCTAVTFLGAGSSRVAVGTVSGGILLLRRKPNETVFIRNAHGNAITSLSASSDGRRLVSLSRKGESARVWDVRERKHLWQSPASREVIQQAVLSPDGKRLLLANQGETAWIWDVEAQTLAARCLLSQPWQERSGLRFGRAIFSPDGKQIVSATHGVGDIQQGILHIWDARTGREMKRYRAEAQKYWNLGFIVDGSALLASRSSFLGDGVITLQTFFAGPRSAEEELMSREFEFSSALRRNYAAQLRTISPEQFAAWREAFRNMTLLVDTRRRSRAYAQLGESIKLMLGISSTASSKINPLGSNDFKLIALVLDYAERNGIEPKAEAEAAAAAETPSANPKASSPTPQASSLGVSLGQGQRNWQDVKRVATQVARGIFDGEAWQRWGEHIIFKSPLVRGDALLENTLANFLRSRSLQAVLYQSS
ncbi:MAG: hypothetical protein HY586_05630, partial [Candidatus Omnitrophica bacterium]|nr:hypothetical protein [Candidatus Omnitrophota bacterium]